MSLRDTQKNLIEGTRERRVSRGWTQAEVARRAGVPLQCISTFEQKGHATLVQFLKICNALNITIDTETMYKDTSRSLSDLKKQAQRSRKKS